MHHNVTKAMRKAIMKITQLQHRYLKIYLVKTIMLTNISNVLQYII